MTSTRLAALLHVLEDSGMIAPQINPIQMIELQTIIVRTESKDISFCTKVSQMIQQLFSK